MYKRLQYNILKDRMMEPRSFIQVIAGARQVGKSTMVKQVLKDITIPNTMETADSIEADDTGWISNLWTAVRQQMQFKNEAEHIL